MQPNGSQQRGTVPQWQYILTLFLALVVPPLNYLARSQKWTPSIWPYEQDKPLTVVVTYALGICGVLILLWRHEKPVPATLRFAPGILNRRTASVIAVVLFIWLASKWHFQHMERHGDGRSWIGFASQPYVFAGEAGGRWAHYFWYRLLESWPSPEKLALRWNSISAGAICLLGLLLLARDAFRQTPASRSIVFLFFFPLLTLYVGYAETTPLAYAFSTIYLLAGLCYLSQPIRRPPWWESVILSLALFMHGIVCFITAAHLYLVICWAVSVGRHSLRNPGKSAALLFNLAWPFAPLLLSIIYAKLTLPADRWYCNMLGGPNHSMWIPWSDPLANKAYYAYTSLRFWQDTGNWVLNYFPLLPLLPLALDHCRRVLPRETTFLFFAFWGLLLFTFSWDAALGYYLDRDLMSLVIVPGHMVILLWLSLGFQARSRDAIIFGYAVSNFAFQVIPYVRFP
ncbi:MAG: hypothetical protein ACR2IE_12275 [Candidatus Sumerlaeaceae bacterium]